MAKDFDCYSNDKGKPGQQPPRREVIPFDSVPRGRNDFRPIDSIKVQTGVSWAGFRPRGGLSGAGPILLLAIAIVCGLYIGISYQKSTAASLQSDKQPQQGATPQPSSPVQPLSKPSPDPSVTARAEVSSMPDKAPNALPNLPGFSAPHYHPMRYEATHKKVFGGCTGQLELTSARLHFKCPTEADLNIPVGSIAKIHKDGVVLASGEKYHFLIANHTKGQVEAILTQWLSRVSSFSN